MVIYTSCDIVSAEDRANSNNNNNRDRLNAFQIYSAFCHCQGSLLPVEGNAPSYAQLYIYDPSYAAQRRSERNENLDNETIENLSALLSECNPFARIYCHAYEILSNHKNFSTNSEDRANNNGSAESESPYIIISSSMRMHLTEEGDKRAHDLLIMEEVPAAIFIEYSNRSCCDIVLTLRSSSRNDSLR
ncbi:uncharacterized protein RHIMIDRAFT_236924 [Rhizopus microsporus ATCC 52813]|uniref:Uncharacterized protein n=1 Tax=Rhizopus microsporus ATCC 52813 TaxID=1340429 RepID=A0A2G4SVV9_RHIZD|nr:uncharacterized protein RHIMIDRAFT_236924 [Rhizopus microsporus ATCC 52813]PHZ12885.1 hypothetical protein RHIMIDRAFT_236924 [Rhizopus microsporus ATCC 52813]